MRPSIALAAFVLSTLAACVVPDQHDPRRFGVVRVGFGPSVETGPDAAGPWHQDQLREMRAQLAVLNRLGPTFVEVPEGEADVVVRPFVSGPACLSGGATRGAGRYPRFGAAYVEVDASCADGYLVLRRIMAHELMHWLTATRYGWVGHICPVRAVGEPEPRTDCHPTIRQTGAILNADVRTSAAAPMVLERFLDEVQAGFVDADPTEADLALLAACQRAGCESTE